MQHLHFVENTLGRQRLQRWGNRTIDLDLIAYGDAVMPDLTTYAEWRDLAPDAQISRTPDRLIIPHPRVQDRAFVLIPLLDVAPDWVHPVSGVAIADMVQALPAGDKQSIRPINP